MDELRNNLSANASASYARKYPYHVGLRWARERPAILKPRPEEVPALLASWYSGGTPQTRVRWFAFTTPELATKFREQYRDQVADYAHP